MECTTCPTDNEMEMDTNRTQTNNKIFGNSNGCDSMRSLKCTQKMMNSARVHVYTCVCVCGKKIRLVVFRQPCMPF
jgi:hypothetical protein